MGYELFDHTADLGLRVTAADLAGLLGEAARGLFAMIVERAAGGGPAERLRLRVEGNRPDHLLLDWLGELLYLFETRGFVLDDVEVRLDDAGLEADLRGRALDPARDRLLREVKAITYHGLRVERGADGWRAEVIVDI